MRSEEWREPFVWLNGRFVELHQAAISPLDRGFLYGDGLFETMRAEGGGVLYLHEHLERMRKSLAALRMDVELRAGDWENVLRELLSRNGLSDRIAVVKLVVARGSGLQGPGLPRVAAATVCALAQSYTPPDPTVYHRGWHLRVFREGFSPPLSYHKTLNYLYFCIARQAALDSGADESVILDPEGNVTETAAGSLLVRTDGRWWTPSSPCQLAGITIGRLRRILSEGGHEVEDRRCRPDDLLSAQTVWVLNSLMGIVPVNRVEDAPMADTASDEAKRLREELFRRGRLRAGCENRGKR